MKIKGKYVLIGLLILVLAWVGNIYYYQKHMIKEPIFIKQYCEISSDAKHFDLYYIENINSKRKVQYVELPEFEPGNIISNIFNYDSDRQYLNYKVIHVQLPKIVDNKMQEQFHKKIITKVKVWYTNGESKEINIGKIYLYKDKEYKEIKLFSRSLISNNNGTLTYKIGKAVKVIEIRSKFSDLLSDKIKISINDIPYEKIKLPLLVNKDKGLVLKYWFKFNDNEIEKYSIYDFPIEAIVEDENSNKSIGTMKIHYGMEGLREYNIEVLKKSGGE